jgi:hypothetical protein
MRGSSSDISLGSLWSARGEGAPGMRLLDLCLIGPNARSGETLARLGVPLLDEYLMFLWGGAGQTQCLLRPTT